MAKIDFVYAKQNFSLTDERAESSYGIPVLVGQDGTAYGPLDHVRPDDGPLGWMCENASTIVLRFKRKIATSEEQKEFALKFLAEAAE